MGSAENGVINVGEEALDDLRGNKVYHNWGFSWRVGQRILGRIPLKI